MSFSNGIISLLRFIILSKVMIGSNKVKLHKSYTTTQKRTNPAVPQKRFIEKNIDRCCDALIFKKEIWS